jgi:pimeloyl-ACP methyl ester carboxylesterase
VQPEPRSVLLHGHRIAYRIAGPEVTSEQPVLLLVHGMAGSSDTWQDVMRQMGPGVTVIAPDLLGHGASDKPPPHDYSLGAQATGLRDLMVALGVEQATVGGHSFGGGVAMQFVYQHPERCERLVLVSSGGLGPEVSWLLRAMALPGMEYLMPVLFPPLVRDAGNALGRQLARLGLRATGIEEQWRNYTSLVDGASRRSFVRTLRSVVDVGGQTVSAHDRLYLASHVPTLIIWGGRDHFIPVGHAHAAHAAIPGSRLEIFDTSGHFPQRTEPRHFAKVLRDFLETTEPFRFDQREWQAVLSAGRPGSG